MGDAAQSVAAPRPVLAVFFGFLAVGVFLFGLYELQRVIATTDEVRILRAALAVLSFGFAMALVYEAVAVGTGRFPTISQIVDQAFTSGQGTWVAVFAVLMFVIGLLALHFTRVAGASSALAQMQRTLSARAHPVIWAIGFAGAIVLTTLAVSFLNRFVLKRDPSDLAFSWWVIYLGGAAYAVGALVAWLFDFRP